MEDRRKLGVGAVHRSWEKQSGGGHEDKKAGITVAAEVAANH